MLYDVFMATSSGLLVALIFVLSDAFIGTPSFPMMSLAAMGIGFLGGAFADEYYYYHYYDYKETEEFNKWIIGLTAGRLMGVGVKAISTGGTS